MIGQLVLAITTSLAHTRIFFRNKSLAPQSSHILLVSLISSLDIAFSCVISLKSLRSSRRVSVSPAIILLSSSHSLRSKIILKISSPTEMKSSQSPIPRFAP